MQFGIISEVEETLLIPKDKDFLFVFCLRERLEIPGFAGGSFQVFRLTLAE